MKKVAGRKTEKYVTVTVFERSMASIARSFIQTDERISERFDRLEAGMMTLQQMMQEYAREAKEHCEKMSVLTISFIKNERSINNLEDRVETLDHKRLKAA